MNPKQQHKQGDIGRRLMWTLLAAIAVIVVVVLFFYGIKDPEKGPGNLPPGGWPGADAERPSPPPK